MIKKKDLSFEDKKIWEDYIKNPSDIFDKEKINSLETKKKIVINSICMVSLLMKQTLK